MDFPRYARGEFERRWLVDPARLPALNQPWRIVEDLYLPGRLRLRVLTWSHTGERELKLGKKYEKTDPLGGPIATLYLTEDEHRLFAGLPGARMRKRRFRLGEFNVDVFEGPLEGLVLTEVEFETPDAARAAAAPPWARREVSDDPFFSGGALACATAAELAARLA